MGILAEAALEAFNNVQTEIPEVIKAVTLVRRIESGSYLPEAGQPIVSQQSWPCRYFEATDKPTRDLIAPYVIGPSERIVMIQGLPVAPRVGDLLGGRAIRAVGDLYGAGEVFVAAIA